MKNTSENSRKKQFAYQNKWISTHCWRPTVTFPIADKERIQAAAKKAGQSISAYLMQAVEARIAAEQAADTVHSTDTECPPHAHARSADD